jgi:HEAT repeat protein
MRRAAIIVAFAAILISCSGALAADSPPASQDVEQLKKQLRSGKTLDERISAARQLAEMKTSDAAFSALVEALRYREEQLQVEVIKGVAGFNSAEAVTALKGVFNSCSENNKVAIVEALAAYKEMGEVDFFITAVRDRSVKVQQAAVEQLNSRRAAPGVAAALLQAMSTTEPTLKKQILGGIPTETTDAKEMQILTKGLTDKDPNVVKSALDALRGMKMDPDKKIDMALLVRKSDDAMVRQTQISVLQGIGTERCVETLLKMARSEKDAGIIMKILGALGKIGGAKAAAGAGEYVSKEDQKIRLAAVQALSAMKIEEAKAPLFKALADEDKQVFDIAVGGLLQFKTPDIIDAVVEAAVSRGDYGVQTKVVGALGAIDDPKSVMGLLKMLDRGDPAVSADVVEQLGAKNAREAIGPIAEQVKKRMTGTDETTWRFLKACVAALQKLGGPEIEEALVLIAQASAPLARAEALSALGDYRDEKAGACLTQALSDPDARIRMTALGSLRKSRYAAAVDAIVSLLNDQNKDVHLAAIEALGEYAAPSTAAKLAVEYNDEILYAAAVAAVANIDSKDEKDFLIKALGNKDNKVRMSAARGLGQSWAKGDADVVRELIALLGREGDRRTRDLAMTGLGNAGTDEAMKQLEALAQSKGADAKPAIAALGLMRSEAAVDILIGLLPKLGYESKMLAIQALANIGNEKAIEPLAQLLEDKQISMRVAAVRAIGRFKSDAAKGVLIKSLQQTNPAVVKAAMLALVKYSDGADVPMVIVQLASHEKPEIRKAAVEAMAYYGLPDMAGPLIAHMKDEAGDVAAASLKSLRRLLNRDLGENDADWSAWREANREKPLSELVDAGFREKGYEIGGAAERKTIGEYMRALGDENDFVRFNAFMRLRAAAGDDFGYDPDMDKGRNRDALDKWNKWWQDNQGKFT